MSPALVIISGLGILPLSIIVVYSFMSPGSYGGIEWKPTLEAWINLLFERDIFNETLHINFAHLAIISRSIGLALAATLLTLFFGFPTAYFIATRPSRQKNFWLFLVILPFCCNLLVRIFAMLPFIRDQGFINHLLINLNIIESPLRIIYTDAAVAIGLVYTYLPLMVMPLYASMEKLNFGLIEAGCDLYGNRWSVLTRIIVPLVKPGIVAGCILVFIPVLGAYVVPRILGGGKHLMLGNLIANQFGPSRDWPMGSVLALFLTAMVMVALMAYVRHTVKSQTKVEHPISDRSKRYFNIGRMPGFTPLALFCLLCLYAPLAMMTVFSFNASRSVTRLSGFSLHWYKQAASNPYVQDAALLSLKLALCAACLATIAATIAALATTRCKPFKGYTLVYGIINQPLMVPEIVMAVAIMAFFGLIKQYTGIQGIGYLLLAHSVFCIPFAYLPIRARLENMDLSFEQAAADLYANPWRVFRRVTLPMVMPGIQAGAMLSFVVSLDDVIISMLVAGPGETTLPVFMLGQLRRGFTPEINAISTVLIGVCVLIVSLVFWLSMKKR